MSKVKLRGAFAQGVTMPVYRVHLSTGKASLS